MAALPSHGGTLYRGAAHGGTYRSFPTASAGVIAPCMNSAPRRSRMRRTPIGKRLELTPRDIEIFNALSRYRYLRSTYLHAFVGGASTKRFKERLGNLFHEGFIDRPDRQWKFLNARSRAAVYENDAGAARVLLDSGVVANDIRTFPHAKPHRQFLHSLMICEALASLDLGARANPRLRYIAWPEIFARAPVNTRLASTPFRIPVPSGGYLVPDGMFGFEYDLGEKKAYRFFALEADRGTMPLVRSDRNQTSLFGKLAAYREIIARQVHKTHLGISTLFVLTITTSQERVN